MNNLVECPYDSEVTVIEINGVRYEREGSNSYSVRNYGFYGNCVQFYSAGSEMGRIPVKWLTQMGAKCFKPKKKVEFVITPTEVFDAGHAVCGRIDAFSLKTFAGKKVKVTVEEL